MSFNPFEGLSKVQIFEKGQYLTEGKYQLRIEEVLYKTSEHKGTTNTIVVTTVVKSNNPDHPIGERRSWVQPMERLGSRKNIKEFLIAALGYDYSDKNDKKIVDSEVNPTLDAAMNEAVTKNGLQGRLINCNVRTVKTKSGGDFSLHEFFPVKTAS